MIIPNFDRPDPNSFEPKYIWVVNDISPSFMAGGCLYKGLFYASNSETTFPDRLVSLAFAMCQPNFRTPYCMSPIGSNLFKNLMASGRYVIVSKGWVPVDPSEQLYKVDACKPYLDKVKIRDMSRQIVTYKRITPCPVMSPLACPPGQTAKKTGTFKDPGSECILDTYTCSPTNCWALTNCCLVDVNLKCLNFGACKSPNRIVPAGVQTVDGCKIPYYRCEPGGPQIR
jgi:hypothetical protein